MYGAVFRVAFQNKVEVRQGRVEFTQVQVQEADQLRQQQSVGILFPQIFCDGNRFFPFAFVLVQIDLREVCKRPPEQALPGFVEFLEADAAVV